MADISAASVPRPQLVFRVGVTVARTVAPEVVSRLRPVVADVQDLVARKWRSLPKTLLAKAVYSAARDGAVPFTSRLLSPLAEGSDRLVAMCAPRG
jgi:hypothetical protein